MEFIDIVAISEYIKGFGPFALLILFALIVLQCHIPVVPFAVASAVCGFIFGFKWGIAISWISVVIGSTIAFYLYRYLNFGNLTQKILGKRKRMPEELIFGFIVVAHNIPVIPIAVPNIIAALSKISTPNFVTATALGLLIPSIGFAAFGSGIESFLVSPSYITLLPIVVILLIFYLLKKHSHKILELISHNIFKKRNK
ncbi:MAG TPA: TVP38/TMEM64 family protein [Gelria sp.]|nr:TVP38/TMEM64 family protein [Gelria sp.]